MKKLWVVFVTGFLVLIMAGCEGSSEEQSVTKLINDEMTANYLYTQLAERYPDEEMFADLAEESALNIEALEKEAARLDVSLEGAKAADIEIPDTRGEALAFAVRFEQADIRVINKMIKNEDDAQLQNLLGDILKTSEDNYDMLKKASDEANPLVVRGCTRCRITQDGQGCQMPR